MIIFCIIRADLFMKMKKIMSYELYKGPILESSKDLHKWPYE